MEIMRRAFVRSLAIALFGFFALFVLEFVVEWHRLGMPGARQMSWAGVNNAKLVDILSPMARAYNNVLAMLIATIGLAIPLTANMHTPKLIDVFLRDPINRFVLAFMALGAAHVLFVDWLIGPEFAPTWAVTITVAVAIIGWAMLIPYFFYVVRFLDPSRVIIRLRDEAVGVVDDVRRGRRDANAAQDEASQRIDQIGTIVLKSLDRADRGVAREGIWAFKKLIDSYQTQKPALPAAWFVVDRADFVGLSADALDLMTTARTWYEMRCLQQMALASQQALSKASDVVSSLSDASRVIATHAAARDDDEALRLSIRFFNNFLREAIKARNAHAVYDVNHQYSLLACELIARPELVREIGEHFVYYADLARIHGLLFAPQLAVFDLGCVVRRAYEAASPAGADLLAHALAIPHKSGADTLGLIVKAKLVLGGFFVERHLDAEAERVRANLRDVDPAQIAKDGRELLDARRVFFEVTDRQLNMEYVRPELREPLQRFCASFAAQITAPA
jgi:hypothetical protein